MIIFIVWLTLKISTISIKLIAVECDNVRVELFNKDDSIKFNLQSVQKMGNLMGSYQYKFDYAGKPVFKQVGGKERYLYWSQKQSEWMVTF